MMARLRPACDAKDVRRGRDRQERRRVEAALDRLDAEAGVPDRSLGVARRLAAAERRRPEKAIGAALHGAEYGVARADVLPEAELPARADHASQLGERGCRI